MNDNTISTHDNTISTANAGLLSVLQPKEKLVN